jgi:ketosteroid isomerase-like protein
MRTQAEDEAQILRLDSEWNEAYRRADRSPLAHILADDFTGWTALNQPITKAILMVNPPGARAAAANIQRAIRERLWRHRHKPGTTPIGI